MEANKITVLLDMDGPLTNWLKAIEGCQRNEDGDPLPMFEQGFFLGLEPTPDALESVRKLLRSEALDVYICTYPTTKNLHCASEKMMWIQRYLPELIKKMHLTCNKDMVEGDYLVDDSPQYWKEGFKGTFITFDDERPVESWRHVIETLAAHDPKLLEY